jgi:hypothetical protein
MSASGCWWVRPHHTRSHRIRSDQIRPDISDSVRSPPPPPFLQRGRYLLQGMAKFCGMGCGLMLLNNIPQTANSLGGGQAEPALFVMIMSTT